MKVLDRPAWACWPIAVGPAVDAHRRVGENRRQLVYWAVVLYR